MRGIAFDAILVILMSVLILAISFIILDQTGVLKGKVLVQPIQIELVATPMISSVSPDSCSGESCTYHLQLKAMAVKSKGASVDALITVMYKGQRKLMPCPDQTHVQQNGACTIDTDGIGFDLSPTFEGSIWTMPPTLNVTDMTDYNGVLIDKQTVMVGKFSVMFSYFELPTVLLKDRARYLVKCADDIHLVIHSVDDESRYTMCDGEIRIKTLDLWRWSPHRVLVNITTSAGKSWTDYDKVNVALWNATLLECANISFAQPIAIAQPVELSEEAALRCFNHMITNWDFDVPVAAWNRATYSQPT